MTSFGDDLREAAADILDSEVVISGVFKVRTAGTVDADEGEITGETISDVTIDISPPIGIDVKRLANEPDLVATDSVIYCTGAVIAAASPSFTPALDMQVVVAGTTYTIVKPNPMRADDGQIAAWELVVRA